MSWTGLTLWSGFIASRHVDYWKTKADEQVMKAKVWYYAQQIRKSREYLDHVRETEISLENLLNMKTRKAIVQSDKAIGGPGRADEKQLAQLLNTHSEALSLDDIKEQFDDMQHTGEGVLQNFQDISSYIKDQHELFRATPISWPTKGRLTSFLAFANSLWTPTMKTVWKTMPKSSIAASISPTTKEHRCRRRPTVWFALPPGRAATGVWL